MFSSLAVLVCLPLYHLLQMEYGTDRQCHRLQYVPVVVERIQECLDGTVQSSKCVRLRLGGARTCISSLFCPSPERSNDRQHYAPLSRDESQLQKDSERSPGKFQTKQTHFEQLEMLSNRLYKICEPVACSRVANALPRKNPCDMSP